MFRYRIDFLGPSFLGFNLRSTRPLLGGRRHRWQPMHFFSQKKTPQVKFRPTSDPRRTIDFPRFDLPRKTMMSRDSTRIETLASSSTPGSLPQQSKQNRKETHWPIVVSGLRSPFVRSFGLHRRRRPSQILGALVTRHGFSFMSSGNWRSKSSFLQVLRNMAPSLSGGSFFSK